MGWSRVLDSDYIKPIYSQKCDYQRRSTSRSLSTRTKCFVVVQTKQTLFFLPILLFSSWLFKYNTNAVSCVIVFFFSLCQSQNMHNHIHDCTACVLHVCVCAYLTSTSLNKATAVTPSAGGHLGSSSLWSLL